MKFKVQTNELKKCAIAQEMFAHHLRMEEQRFHWLTNNLSMNALGLADEMSKLEEKLHCQAGIARKFADELDQIQKIYARTEDRLRQ